MFPSQSFFAIFRSKTPAEKNCFEQAGLSRIKVQMKTIPGLRSGRLWTGALLAFLFFGFSTEAGAQFIFTNTAPKPLPRRTSVIVIVADGLGYGDLSCYGQTKFQTPNLDRLAAEGMRFTGYYAGDAMSSPARAALMLGRDSGHLKQRSDVEVPLAADDISLAHMLKQAGYHTGLIGEWDLGGDGTGGAPWNKGFDEFAGFFDAGAAENYFADQMWRYDAAVHINGSAAVYANADGKKGQYLPDLFTTMAMNFMRNNQPDQFNKHRPFFLLLNYTAVRANAAEMARTGNGMQVPTDAPFSEEPWPQPEKNQAAMIARLDANIGQLLDQLKKLGLDSNTVVFFTSDTGPHHDGGVDPNFFQSAGPFRGERGGLYEGGLHVPMIARWPGKIPAGLVSDLNWAAWDVLPTLADIALTQSPTNVDGVSILPALAGKPLAQPREIFFRWELHGPELAQAARLGDWKIVRSKSAEKWELYNLKTDPGETRNVADKYPKIIAAFEAGLKNFDNPKYPRPALPAPDSTDHNL